MKLSNEDYVARISSATSLQLVIITYELAIGNISEAIEIYDKDTMQFKEKVNKAKEFLASLIDALDLNLDIGRKIMDVYIQVNRLLIEASMKNIAEPLGTARIMLNNMLEGWREIEKNDSTQQVMTGAQQVYAGLTYGKEGLNEYIPEDANRGFKA